MASWPRWVLNILLLVCPPAAGVAQSPLWSGQVYTSGDDGNGSATAVLAPHVVLAGAPVELAAAAAASASTAEACAELCRADPRCAWFNYCPAQEGCVAGDASLQSQRCLLLAPDGTAVPQVEGRGIQVATTAGFPLRIKPRTFPGFTSVSEQGMEGSDYSCPGSLLPPAQCAFRTPVEAAVVCMTTLACRTIVVYVNGTDGSSPGQLAVLKSANLPPAATFVSPTVYSITRLDNRPISATYLYDSDGDTILPTPEEAASNSSWRGCFIGRNAAVDGVQVARVAQVPSAEACCRTCQAWGASTNGSSACNAWNYCPAAGGCRLALEDGALLELAQHECELRFQDIIQPSIAFPVALFAKGPGVPFFAGGPIMTAGPQVPGFTLMPGKGLFTFGRYNCSGSLRPEVQECVLQMPIDQLATYCLADPECVAFILKQDGIFGAAKSLGIFKHASDPAAVLFNPTGLLYLRDLPATPDALSSAAIAGIAVGASAAAMLLFGGAAWLLLQRRRRRLHEEQAKLAGSQGRLEVAGVAAAENGCSSLAAVSWAGFAKKSGGAASGIGSGSPAPSAFPGLLLPQASAAPGAAGLMPAATEALPELAQHIAAHDAAANSAGAGSSGSSGDSPPVDPHQAMLLAALPAGVRDFVVDSSSITYRCLTNGKPHELGAGASGKVYKAVYNGELVAAKEVDIGSSAAMQQTFITEAVRLHQLRHSAVVGFVGVAISGTKGVLLMEYCEARDLYAALPLKAAGTNQRLFGWHRLGRRVAFDLARALNYLHSKGVVHLDVKSSNVLLTATGAAKLADVGFAVLQTKTYLSDLPLVGTYAWVAPEVLMGGRQCTQAVDLFSFGVVLWEIVTGETPQRGRLRPPLVPQECPQDIADLILRCTSAEPQERPSAQQVMEQLGGLLRRGGGGGMASSSTAALVAAGGSKSEAG